jgi:hypothetical protein
VREKPSESEGAQAHANVYGVPDEKGERTVDPFCSRVERGNDSCWARIYDWKRILSLPAFRVF